MAQELDIGKVEGVARQGLRWGVERRLEFIDFRLFWDGRINRGDLTEQFGISIPQASADLARYRDMAPQNMSYDPSLKCYLASQAFRPVFEVEDAGRYLARLNSLASGTIAREEAWIAETPDFRIVPTPGRSVDSRSLKAVLRGIRDHLALCIRYQSMSRPEPHWRWITPHALGFDGFRWHVRALCHNDETFKDFVFARIYEIGESRPHAMDSGADEGWFDSVTVIISPHPGLSESQVKAVKLDYGMPDGVRAITVSSAFLYYFLKHMGLFEDPQQKRPQDQQIVLVNREEVMSAMKRGWLLGDVKSRYRLPTSH